MDLEVASLPLKRSLSEESQSLKSSNSSSKQLKTEESVSSADKLESLIATFYPQYARIRYVPIKVESDGGKNGTSTVRWRCKVYLFEMHLECREYFLTFEEAREAVAKLALELLIEFNTIVHSRGKDARFTHLFQPLIDEMTASLANSMVDPMEEETVAQGHAPVLSVEQYKETGSLHLQKSVLSATLSAVYEKMSSTGIVQKTVKQSQQQQPKQAPARQNSNAMQVESGPIVSTEDQLTDPLSAVHMHFQKRGGSVQAPDLQIFDGKSRNLFGCIGKYDGKSYIAEGIYKTKKEAKKAAAVLMCQDLFGMNCPVAGSATVDAGKDLASSGEDPASTGSELRIDPAPERLTETPPAGKRFVSMVNECCQVHHLGQPDYQCRSGESISNYYIIHALNIFDTRTIEVLGGKVQSDEELPKVFVSSAFTKKNDAKEDCAGRIFVFLREHGVFDAAGALTRKSEPKQQRYNSSYHGTRSYNQQSQVPMKRAPPIPAIPSWPPSVHHPVGVPLMPPMPFFSPPPHFTNNVSGMPPMPPMQFPGMMPPPFPMFPSIFGAPPPSSQQQPPQAPNNSDTSRQQLQSSQQRSSDPRRRN